MGAQHRNNPEARAEWAEYFVSSAKEIGIPCFWWDNGAVRVSSVTTEGFGLLNRSTNEIVFPEVVEALLRGSES
jgi:endoglucanase